MLNVLADAKDLAAKLQQAGLSGPYASQLARGERTPSYDKAMELERTLGIAASHWSTRKAAAAAMKAGAAA